MLIQSFLLLLLSFYNVCKRIVCSTALIRNKCRQRWRNSSGTGVKDRCIAVEEGALWLHDWGDVSGNYCDYWLHCACPEEKRSCSCLYNHKLLIEAGKKQDVRHPSLTHDHTVIIQFNAEWVTTMAALVFSPSWVAVLLLLPISPIFKSADMPIKHFFFSNLAKVKDKLWVLHLNVIPSNELW